MICAYCGLVDMTAGRHLFEFCPGLLRGISVIAEIFRDDPTNKTDIEDDQNKEYKLNSLEDSKDRLRALSVSNLFQSKSHMTLAPQLK